MRRSAVISHKRRQPDEMLLDASGLPASGELKVTERYALDANGNTGFANSKCARINPPMFVARCEASFKGGLMKYSKYLGVLFAALLAVAVTEPRTLAAEKKEISLEPTSIMLPSGTVEVIDTGGEGVPLLLLHPVNIRLWQNQIPAFAKAGYRVIAVDSRDQLVRRAE